MSEENSVPDFTLSPQSSPCTGGESLPNDILQDFKLLPLEVTTGYAHPNFQTQAGALTSFDYHSQSLLESQYTSGLSFHPTWHVSALESSGLDTGLATHVLYNVLPDAHCSDSSSAYSSPGSQAETLVTIADMDDYRTPRCFTPFSQGFSCPASPLAPLAQACNMELSVSPIPVGWADSDMSSGMQSALAQGSQTGEDTATQTRIHSPASNTSDLNKLCTTFPSRRATHPTISRSRRQRHAGRSHLRSIVDRFHCPCCNKSFSRREKLKGHMVASHQQHPSEIDSMRIGNKQPALLNRVSAMDPDPAHEEELLPLTKRLKAEDNVLELQTDVCDLEEQTLEARAERTSEKVRPSRFLACPYQKFDPQRHQECLKYELHRIRDVKQHIYRRHRQPDYYCARCFSTFETAEDRDEHARRSDCKRQPALQFEGISDGQKKKLNEKSCRTVDVTEQWYQMWEIVFPKQPRPRTVYLGSYLEETVPLLRKLWAVQSTQIMAQVAGGEGCMVDKAMQLFFERLEEETATAVHDGASRNMV